MIAASITALVSLELIDISFSPAYSINSALVISSTAELGCPGGLSLQNPAGLSGVGFSSFSHIPHQRVSPQILVFTPWSVTSRLGAIWISITSGGGNLRHSPKSDLVGLSGWKWLQFQHSTFIGSFLFHGVHCSQTSGQIGGRGNSGGSGTGWTLCCHDPHQKFVPCSIKGHQPTQESEPICPY